MILGQFFPLEKQKKMFLFYPVLFVLIFLVKACSMALLFCPPRVLARSNCHSQLKLALISIFYDGHEQFTRVGPCSWLPLYMEIAKVALQYGVQDCTFFCHDPKESYGIGC